jgi:cyclic pyranopterin monophosphate synthase
MLAVKQTSTLGPLCPPIRLADISVVVTAGLGEVVVTATTETVERTGVEMEALTACVIAALAIRRLAPDVVRPPPLPMPCSQEAQ